MHPFTGILMNFCLLKPLLIISSDTTERIIVLWLTVDDFHSSRTLLLSKTMNADFVAAAMLWVLFRLSC
jgi:hypothetical protein